MASAHPRPLLRAAVVPVLLLAASACADLATSPLARSDTSIQPSAPSLATSAEVVVYDFEESYLQGLSPSYGTYPFPATYRDLRIDGGSIYLGKTQISVSQYTNGQNSYAGPTTRALHPEHLLLPDGAPIPVVRVWLPRQASVVSIGVLYYNGNNIYFGRGGEAAFIAYDEGGAQIGRIDVPRTAQMFRFETLTLTGAIHSVGIVSGKNTAAWDNLTVTYGVLDSSAPEITSSLAGTLGQNGWYTSDVAVSWSAVDAESPVTSAACPASALAIDTQGASFACTATSGGGTATATVSVKRDATAPVIAFTGNAGSYAVDQQVAITCTATDATSGIATSDCPGATGAAFTFAAANTLSASATDQAGNTAVSQTTFTIQVAPAGLLAVTQQLVSDAGVAEALGAKLSAVAEARARGNEKAAAGQIAAFIQQVNAQRGKKITTANADTLIRLAQAL